MEVQDEAGMIRGPQYRSCPCSNIDAQLAEAGWKYTPTLDSDDHTTCTYCQLALDGWEASDKPLYVF